MAQNLRTHRQLPGFALTGKTSHGVVGTFGSMKTGTTGRKIHWIPYTPVPHITLQLHFANSSTGYQFFEMGIQCAICVFPGSRAYVADGGR